MKEENRITSVGNGVDDGFLSMIIDGDKDASKVKVGSKSCIECHHGCWGPGCHKG